MIPSVNLERTGINAFTKLLAREYGVDFDVMAGRKKLIRATLVEAINEQGSDEEDEEDSEEEDKNEESDVDDDDDDDGGPPTMKKKRAGGGGGLATKKEISPELAKFLGFRPNEMVARTEIVKKLWDYIRQNDLQNPNNKKEILLDKKMRNVFGCEMFTMFTMNKYISAHVHPFKPVDLTPKVKEGGDRSAKKRRRLSSGKADGSRSKGSKKTKSAGAGGNSNQPPYRLSPALVDVTQADVLPRPQVVKALWAYIRLHNLQVCGRIVALAQDRAVAKVLSPLLHVFPLS